MERTSVRSAGSPQVYHENRWAVPEQQNDESVHSTLASGGGPAVSPLGGERFSATSSATEGNGEPWLPESCGDRNSSLWKTKCEVQPCYLADDRADGRTLRGGGGHPCAGTIVIFWNQ